MSKDYDGGEDHMVTDGNHMAMAGEPSIMAMVVRSSPYQHGGATVLCAYPHPAPVSRTIVLRTIVLRTIDYEQTALAQRLPCLGARPSAQRP